MTSPNSNRTAQANKIMSIFDIIILSSLSRLFVFIIQVTKQKLNNIFFM